MADDIIRIKDLAPRPSPVASEVIPVDNGSTVGGATIAKIVEIGRPTASQQEAVEGTHPYKAMTPLTTRQAIEAIGISPAQRAEVIAARNDALNSAAQASSDASTATAAAGTATGAAGTAATSAGQAMSFRNQAQQAAQDAQAWTPQYAAEALQAASAAVAQTELDANAAAADRIKTSLDVVSTAANAVSAAAARDAAISAGTWNYSPVDAAARAAITGMTEGQLAYQRDTMHLWKYVGSSWVDQGISPLGSYVSQTQQAASDARASAALERPNLWTRAELLFADLGRWNATSSANRQVVSKNGLKALRIYTNAGSDGSTTALFPRSAFDDGSGVLSASVRMLELNVGGASGANTFQIRQLDAASAVISSATASVSMGGVAGNAVPATYSLDNIAIHADCVNVQFYIFLEGSSMASPREVFIREMVISGGNSSRYVDPILPAETVVSRLAALDRPNLFPYGEADYSSTGAWTGSGSEMLMARAFKNGEYAWKFTVPAGTLRSKQRVFSRELFGDFPTFSFSALVVALDAATAASTTSIQIHQLDGAGAEITAARTTLAIAGPTGLSTPARKEAAGVPFHADCVAVRVYLISHNNGSGATVDRNLWIREFYIAPGNSTLFAPPIAGTSAASRWAGKTGYFFGDSITQGTEGGYVGLVAEKLGCNSSNFGVSGNRSGGTVNRMTDIVRSGEPTYSSYPDYTLADFATIMIGTNDVTASYPMGTLADIPTSKLSDFADPYDYWALFPATYIGNVALCIEFAKWKNRELKVYLVSSPHYAGNGSWMIPVVNALTALAPVYSVPYLNATYECGIDLKNKLDYAEDGTSPNHLNVLGNRVFADWLAARLLSS